MKALVFRNFGGPEVLFTAEVEDPVVQAETVIVRTKAIGLNFADVYRRNGNYHLVGKSPWILGYEGAGVVEQIGSNVKNIKIGDRVGFADVPYSNAELVSVEEDRVIPLPPEISFETAAAVLLQGMTAHYLVTDSYPVQASDYVLIHAAAGGVGQLLTQLAKNKGARVIGLTSSEEKRYVSLSLGADEVFLYGQNWPEHIHQFTKIGASVAYDSVGTTLLDSFSAVRTKGSVVFYGMAGGDPAPIDPRMLMDTSKTLTGGDLWNHVTTKEERIARASSLFSDITSGKLRLNDPITFALKEGAAAHHFLESRRSTGKIILIP